MIEKDPDMATERHVKALEAVRDVTKQVVTIQAALLTFGLALVKDITKGEGPKELFVTAVIALLVGAVAGLIALLSAVGSTHTADGTINDKWIMGPLRLCVAGLVVGAGAIGIYLGQAPINLSSTTTTTTTTTTTVAP